MWAGTRLDKVQRGQAAKHLLENELLKEIMNDLDGLYHARWRQAATIEAREDLFRYVKVLERISLDIRAIAQTGKIEENRLKELEGKPVAVPLNEWKRGA